MAGNICVTRQIPQAGIDLLGTCGASLKINPHDRPLTGGELRDFVPGCDAVLCTLADTLDEATLEAAGPSCRIIANYAVGYNNIDIDAASRRGILVTNTPGVLTDATADLAWALILAAARRIVEADAHFRTGQWTGWGPMQFQGYGMSGATIGIVGAGRIGTAVARRAAGFSMHILYTSRQRRPEMEALGGQFVDLAVLLRQSDVISLHVPLTPETHHLLGAAQLATMKPTAVLINTSRGPIIDEQALVAALRTGQIAAAGLDVYEAEPRPASGLVDLKNVVLLPHIGSATYQTRATMATLVAGSILSALAGARPANLVNPQTWPGRCQVKG
jgi:glyoxylate reductase